jgi:NOL1/NOP2/fmu family ribosome biogenesis protein
MQTLTILNSKEIKRIREIITVQFGHFFTEDYAYLRTDKDKIYMINKDVARIDWDKLIVDKAGMYFGEDKGNEIRLSKEGTQLLALDARKNKVKLKDVVELDGEETKRYFLGEDIITDLGVESRLVLLKYNQDLFGCAKYKEGKILNFMPKVHRGDVVL